MPKTIYVKKRFRWLLFRWLFLFFFLTLWRSGLTKKVANGTKWTLRWQNTWYLVLSPSSQSDFSFSGHNANPWIFLFDMTFSRSVTSSTISARLAAQILNRVWRDGGLHLAHPNLFKTGDWVTLREMVEFAVLSCRKEVYYHSLPIPLFTSQKINNKSIVT